MQSIGDSDRFIIGKGQIKRKKKKSDRPLGLDKKNKSQRNLISGQKKEYVLCIQHDDHVGLPCRT